MTSVSVTWLGIRIPHTEEKQLRGGKEPGLHCTEAAQNSDTVSTEGRDPVSLGSRESQIPRCPGCDAERPGRHVPRDSLLSLSLSLSLSLCVCVWCVGGCSWSHALCAMGPGWPGSEALDCGSFKKKKNYLFLAAVGIVASQGLSLVATSEGYSLLMEHQLEECGLSSYGVQA